MKKPSLFTTGSALLLIIAAIASYLYWAKTTFVSREIKRRTGAVEVHVLDESHSDAQWYGKAEIDPQTGRLLLARYKWERGFKKDVALAGKIVSDRPSDCPNCFYRISVDPHEARFHPYDYTVYVMSPDMKVLEVYEVFGG
jgi:hypothetical protein